MPRSFFCLIGHLWVPLSGVYPVGFSSSARTRSIWVRDLRPQRCFAQRSRSRSSPGDFAHPETTAGDFGPCELDLAWHPAFILLMISAPPVSTTRCHFSRPQRYLPACASRTQTVESVMFQKPAATEFARPVGLAGGHELDMFGIRI